MRIRDDEHVDADCTVGQHHEAYADPGAYANPANATEQVQIEQKEGCLEKEQCPGCHGEDCVRDLGRLATWPPQMTRDDSRVVTKNQAFEQCSRPKDGGP